MSQSRITNREYAKLKDSSFRKSCDNSGIDPTPRQASKWRKHKGAARKRLTIHGDPISKKVKED